MAQTKCARCGAENDLAVAKCVKCGAELVAAGAPTPSQESMYGFDEMNKPPISWPAAGLGLLIILGLQVLIGLTVVPFLSSSILGGRAPNVVGFWAAMLILGFAIYFTTGFVLGRYSKGYLVREPMIAAFAAAAANGLLERFVLRNHGVSLVMILAGSLVWVGVAYLGGMAGEQVQQKKREERRVLAAMMAKKR